MWTSSELLGLFWSSLEGAGEVSRHLETFSEGAQKSLSTSEQQQIFFNEVWSSMELCHGGLRLSSVVWRGSGVALNCLETFRDVTEKF